ncbi:MAG: sodium-translocating pyrophosphatase [Candidatus Amoebophilus sp. 36-38]|nr:MAG: sodium-translocating pyrophosphatase [Candidatus Amoebophilus sp. 36-38]
MTYNLLYFLPIIGIFILFFTSWRSNWVSRQEAGDQNMVEISHNISQGANSFLRAVYKTLIPFALVACLLLLGMSFLPNSHTHPVISITFLLGAFTSALSGWIGMRVATKANVRTTQAARHSLANAFRISFTGGTVMGMGVTGLATLGISSLLCIFFYFFAPQGIDTANRDTLVIILETITGFSLGAESVALFARVAGGIYTKAADVGADLVGKIEAGIPEDDPRNPATIADNVGDNVGDVAGMGADLFGSYVATILAAMVLGNEVDTLKQSGRLLPIFFPLFIGVAGTLISIIASFMIRISEGGNVQKAINKGNWAATILIGVAAYFLANMLLPESLSMRSQHFTNIDVFYAIVTGLLVGVLVGNITQYFTEMGQSPVRFIIQQSNTGHATNIIAGLYVGMSSVALPMLLFAAGIYTSFKFAGFYGVAIAAASMMATTMLQLSIDAFGPIADNAGGIAEMSGLPQEVRQRTDVLDSVGNTTAATGKGFAIASAALTSLALFAAFVKTANIDSIDIYKAPVLAGLFVGGMIPFLFSALAIKAVGKAAMAMVQEVRRQFREISGIMEGKAKPEYEKCVQISTQAALKGMLLPGALAILTPLLVGILYGPEVLGGLLAGITVSGVLMAMFQSNAGGAWDNAKKSFEKGVEIDGKMYYKGSEPHKASVTGDTVGDPLKDTSGPSMNILIKLASIVALVIAPIIALPASHGAKTTTSNKPPMIQQDNHHHAHELDKKDAH